MRVYAGDPQEKIADIETRVNGLSREIGTFGTSFETRLAAAEKSLAKHYAVNEALKRFIENSDPDAHEPFLNAVRAREMLIATLRKALKND